MGGRGWPKASESCPRDRGQKSLMHTDEENTPSTSPRDSLGGTERQIGVAKAHVREARFQRRGKWKGDDICPETDTN